MESINPIVANVSQSNVSTMEPSVTKRFIDNFYKMEKNSIAAIMHNDPTYMRKKMNYVIELEMLSRELQDFESKFIDTFYEHELKTSISHTDPMYMSDKMTYVYEYEKKLIESKIAESKLNNNIDSTHLSPNKLIDTIETDNSFDFEKQHINKLYKGDLASYMVEKLKCQHELNMEHSKQETLKLQLQLIEAETKKIVTNTISSVSDSTDNKADSNNANNFYEFEKQQINKLNNISLGYYMTEKLKCQHELNMEHSKQETLKLQLQFTEAESKKVVTNTPVVFSSESNVNNFHEFEKQQIKKVLPTHVHLYMMEKLKYHEELNMEHSKQETLKLQLQLTEAEGKKIVTNAPVDFSTVFNDMEQQHLEEILKKDQYNGYMRQKMQNVHELNMQILKQKELELQIRLAEIELEKSKLQ